jgi:hypothetical protein
MNDIGWTTVVETLAELLARLGSGSAAETRTPPITVPAPSARTARSTVTEASGGRLGTESSMKPFTGVSATPSTSAVMNVVPEGIDSVNPTLVAVEGPLFVKTAVYVNTVPL